MPRTSMTNLVFPYQMKELKRFTLDVNRAQPRCKGQSVAVEPFSPPFVAL
jgi:hypothetical protein